MAYIYGGKGKRGIQKIVAMSDDVQDGLDDFQLEVALRAESLLRQHRETGNAKIELERGRIDRYVVLDDPAALSIEFGRAGYIDPDTEEEWGGSPPLYILSRAAHLRNRRPPRQPTKRRKRGWVTRDD